MTAEERKSLLSHKISNLIYSDASTEFVVEEFLYGVSASPSIFFECGMSSKKLEPLFIHDQILMGSEGYYGGCTSMVSGVGERGRQLVAAYSGRIRDHLCRISDKITFLGLDAVVTKGEEVYFIDSNIRMVAGYIPFTVSQKISGARPLQYFNVKFAAPLAHLPSVEKLMRFLRAMLYPQGGFLRGVVILATFPFRFSGKELRYIDCLCLDEDLSGAERIKNQLSRILHSL